MIVLVLAFSSLLLFYGSCIGVVLPEKQWRYQHQDSMPKRNLGSVSGIDASYVASFPVISVSVDESVTFNGDARKYSAGRRQLLQDVTFGL